MNDWFSFDTLKYFAQSKNLSELKFSNDKNCIAFFDLDNTLITTKNAKPIYYSDSDPNNWIFIGPVLQMLKMYYMCGYYIIIVSNQSKFNNIISRKINIISKKINKYCGFEPIFFCACANDIYRKPNIGIIDFIEYHIKSNQIKIYPILLH